MVFVCLFVCFLFLFFWGVNGWCNSTMFSFHVNVMCLQSLDDGRNVKRRGAMSIISYTSTLFCGRLMCTGNQILRALDFFIIIIIFLFFLFLYSSLSSAAKSFSEYSGAKGIGN